jgi:outer membrane lipoprotein LolB
MRNTVAILCAVLLLAACATGPRPVPDDRRAAWEELRTRLSAVDQWRAEGRLAVRTAEDGGQAGFTWIELPDGRFRLRLAGPWGQGATRLLGGDGSARLVAGDGRRYVGADARSLLAGLYGWNIPVDGLRRWLIGLPGEGAEFTLDRFGRIETLRWQGWRLEYGRYRPVGDLELPAVLRARHAASGTEVRVAVDEWRLGADDGDAPAPGSPVPLMGS